MICAASEQAVLSCSAQLAKRLARPRTEEERAQQTPFTVLDFRGRPGRDSFRDPFSVV